MLKFLEEGTLRNQYDLRWNLEEKWESDTCLGIILW